MHLIQIHIPVAGPGRPGASAVDLRALQKDLTDRFGGATAALRNPATGLWRESDENVEEDQIVVFDVMVAVLERSLWEGLRRQWEQRFLQKVILIRVLPVQVI